MKLLFCKYEIIALRSMICPINFNEAVDTGWKWISAFLKADLHIQENAWQSSPRSIPLQRGSGDWQI